MTYEEYGPEIFDLEALCSYDDPVVVKKTKWTIVDPLTKPDFTLDSSRWALGTPCELFDAKLGAKVQKAAKKAKEACFFDKKLGMWILPKIEATQCTVETLLGTNPMKNLSIVDRTLVICDNSMLKPGVIKDSVRFTLANPADVFIRTKGKQGVVKFFGPEKATTILEIHY